MKTLITIIIAMADLPMALCLGRKYKLVQEVSGALTVIAIALIWFFL